MRVFPALVTMDRTSHIGRMVIIHDKKPLRSLVRVGIGDELGSD